MKFHVSVRAAYLSLIVSFFFALALLDWFVLIPCGIWEYNLGVNILTSSIFMALTIVLLTLLFNALDESEWKPVKEYVYQSIQAELGLLFMEMLNYVKDGWAIKSSFMTSVDQKTSDEIALSELRKLKDAKQMKLDESKLQILFTHPSELNAFSEALNNLTELQIMYHRFFPSQLTKSFMKIRDSIRGLEQTARSQKPLRDMMGLPETTEPIKDEMLKANSTLLRESVSFFFKEMMQEIDNIHQMGIEFSPPFIPPQIS